jgi:hypothetical protein
MNLLESEETTNFKERGIAIASGKKIFLYFPIWSCVNTMTCGGGHLGFQIITKNTNLIRDHLEPLGQLKPNCPGIII